jgi:hypothetical protein
MKDEKGIQPSAFILLTYKRLPAHRAEKPPEITTTTA